MEYIISSGESSEGIILENASMTVFDGGITNITTVNSGGRLYVSSGGTANSTTVNFNGYLYISSGGTANNTTVNFGDYFFVSSGGTANSDDRENLREIRQRYPRQPVIQKTFDDSAK